jgi:LmbE family N-acetylglucosaminyl deacetylase
VGSGALLQRIDDPIVVFVTDGAPRSRYFWESHGSRESYARVRAREAELALAAAGIAHWHVLRGEDPIADQELYLNLRAAYDALSQVIEWETPHAIVSHAYEGGHPDHDACSFLASLALRQYELPVWEMPLYHRAGGTVRSQSFIDHTGEIEVHPSVDERERKRLMFSAYTSQTHVLGGFANPVERFRPIANYDFARVPHPGVLNYEGWQWPMVGSDLCRAFTEFLRDHPQPARKYQWGTVA